MQGIFPYDWVFKSGGGGGGGPFGLGLERNGAMKFWGGSFVANPFGTVLYKASHEDEEVKVVEIDTAKTDQYRTHWPFLRDRRIDSYQQITKRYIDQDA